MAKGLCVHQHGTGSRRIEPGQIEHSLRLTGAQKVPLSVGPGLYPGMIVIGVSPAGRVDLSGRNAHGTQGSHRERAFLTTAPIGRPEGGKRSRGAAVGRLVGDMLMTPMVDLQNGIIHTHAADTVLQFLVKDHARTVEMLIVHPDRQHKVAEEQVGHSVAPRHVAPGLETGAHILLKETTRIVRLVSQGHEAIKEVHGLLYLLGRQSCVICPVLLCCIRQPPDLQPWHQGSP